MRNPSLHAALRALAEAAAHQLGTDVAAGADVPFELVERRGGRGSLYSYSPLTAEFVRARMGSLGRLDEYVRAARAMRDLGGLDVYLRSRGERRIPEGADERVDAALRCWLTRVWEDRAEFEVTEERFGVAYGELEATVYATRWLVCAAVPVLGLLIESPRVALGDGIWLVRADGREDLPADASWAAEPDGDSGPAVVLLELEARPDRPVSLAHVRGLLAELRTALRLYDDEPLTLAPVGWVREDAGAWQLLSLGGGGRDDGALHLTAAQEDEMRAFVNLVRRRRPRTGEAAWALRRFELACERVDPLESLTDALIAGRALLEPEGAGSGRLAARIAAICAEPDDRAELAEEVAHAVSLERGLIAGLAPAVDEPAALATAMLGHLRAILRDLVCGHLEADLVGLADRLVLADAEAGEGTEEDAGFAAGPGAGDDAGDTVDFAVESSWETADFAAIGVDPGQVGGLMAAEVSVRPAVAVRPAAAVRPVRGSRPGGSRGDDLAIDELGTPVYGD